MADSSVPITAGSGTNIDTYAISGGDHQQIVRQAKATAVTINTWTPTTSGQASQIAADASRVAMMIVNDSNSKVYLRFDSTIPTAATYSWYLDSNDRWEVPEQLVTLAVSMLGEIAGTGTVNSTLATAA